LVFLQSTEQMIAGVLNGEENLGTRWKNSEYKR
jgi:hypothetical protein